ncbi:MAG: hypothetical protein ACSLFM_01735 [Tepidiformaceae bacterium]
MASLPLYGCLVAPLSRAVLEVDTLRLPEGSRRRSTVAIIPGYQGVWKAPDARSARRVG